MCNRLNQHLTHLERREVLKTGVLPEWAVRFNVGFTTQTLMLRRDGPDRMIAGMARWGLVPSWSRGAGDPRCRDLFHARAETLHEKPSFREAFAARRCVVPVAGFYETESIGRGERQNWYVRAANQQEFFLAGLYEIWSGGEEPLVSLAVVTTAPNLALSQIHDRMPVVLDDDAAVRWLDRPDPALLSSCPEGRLVMSPVSNYVSRRGSEGPQCIEPARSQKFLFGS